MTEMYQKANMLKIRALILIIVITACSPSARAECNKHFSDDTNPNVINQKLEKGTHVLCYSAFTVFYSGVTKTPLYVAEHLTIESVNAARALDTRDNRFHPELRLPAEDRSELADYRGSGFDRGHMAPSGDMGNPEDDYESFSLANIVPQASTLNRYGWASLESYVRDLAGRFGQAYVLTGPLFEGANIQRINSRVLVPSAVWKAVYVPGQGAGAWIATNQDDPRWEVVSIAALSARTGIDPFPKLDDATKKKVPAFPTFGD